MAVYGLLAKAAGTVVTGFVGVTAYELARKALNKAPLHESAVSAAELGLRGTRKAEEAAESARLKLADVRLTVLDVTLRQRPEQFAVPVEPADQHRLFARRVDHQAAGRSLVDRGQPPATLTPAPLARLRGAGTAG